MSDETRQTLDVDTPGERDGDLTTASEKSASVEIDPLATGDATSVHSTSLEGTSDEPKPSVATPVLAGGASASSAGLPAPENQPPLQGGERGDDVRSQAEENSGVAGTFAEREGFVGDGAAQRRDLGEFDDDETVLAAAEPAETAPVEPYRDPHDFTAAGNTPPSFGSLLGAGLLGGLIAAALGAGLLYSGLIPTGREQGAEQYAEAGEMQAVRGEVQSLTERLDQVQSAQAAGGATTEFVSASELAALTDRVTAAERTVQTNAEGGAGATASIDEIRGQAEAASAAAEEAGQQAEAAGQQAGSAEAAASQASQAIEGFSTRLDAIEEANRQAALAFAAAGLKSAIDRGGPFMPELESFAAASGDAAPVDALRDFAASGVPTLEQLVDAWPETEAEILAIVRAPEAGDDVGAQVLSGLSALVTVRPSEGAPPSDEGAEAIVSRLRAALESGDLATWQSEYDALPEAARTTGQAFAADVAARRQAMQVVDDALAGASAAATAPQEG